MLATFVIGLREGLEAALIVGIVAAFLRRNGQSLRPMWIGVWAAVALSLAVGVALRALEAALPQAAQEGLETVIGVVAVVFVTGMILWMQAHARGMKHALEAEAASALQSGTAWALAGMAFLAVLKEGFETSVFLLATFQAATDATLAATGAVLGIVVAALVGMGIYRGGVRLDLARFFRATGLFLVFVAAGLVVNALRTAHEAGWVNVGQQATIDLSWLAPAGSVQAALMTGVLGIPADPRAIEVVGWFGYLIPMLCVLYLPARLRPSAAQLPRAQLVAACGLAAAAVVLALAVPPVTVSIGKTAEIVAGSSSGTASIARSGDAAIVTVRTDGGAETVRLPASAASTTTRSGVTSTAWTVTTTSTEGPARLTLDDLIRLAGGRVPVGIDRRTATGPFTAAWSVTTTRHAWAAGTVLIDASQTVASFVTVSGGGLTTARTVAATQQTAPTAWRVPQATVDDRAAAVAAASVAAAERMLWAVWLPVAALVAALTLTLSSFRRRRRARRLATTPITTPQPRSTADAIQ